MKTLGMILSTAFLASPALANLGNINDDLDKVTPERAALVQPLLTPSHVVATADTCALPSDHIVHVPSAFSSLGVTEMACLTE